MIYHQYCHYGFFIFLLHDAVFPALLLDTKWHNANFINDVISTDISHSLRFSLFFLEIDLIHGDRLYLIQLYLADGIWFGKEYV